MQMHLARPVPGEIRIPSSNGHAGGEKQRHRKERGQGYAKLQTERQAYRNCLYFLTCHPTVAEVADVERAYHLLNML